MVPRPIRVLVIDDSAVVRRLVTTALQTDKAIEVVGVAADPYAARDQIQQLAPDVLTLDLEMPRMDGLTFLKILMEQRPLPVIVMSSLTARGSDHALEALRLGAFDVLGKPAGAFSFGELGAQLIARIKAAAVARVTPFRHRPALAVPRALSALSIAARHPRSVILLGASTGGTQALQHILTQLPAGLPGIAIVQHIPAVFSRQFADRLNTSCALEVREARDGDVLAPGLALIAPGNFHLLLRWEAGHHVAHVVDGPSVWHQRPAVDLLFKSAADTGSAPHAIAGLLTGMGQDGAAGLLRLRQQGATTFAQDEATSVVYGMPRVAWENGAAQRQLPLDQVASHLVQHHLSSPAPATALA